MNSWADFPDDLPWVVGSEATGQDVLSKISRLALEPTAKQVKAAASAARRKGKKIKPGQSDLEVIRSNLESVPAHLRGLRFDATVSVTISEVSLMDELTRLLAAVKAANAAQATLAECLEAFGKRVGLVDTLAAFPVDPPLNERGSPPPSVGALKIVIAQAVESWGRQAVVDIVAAEAGGKKIAEMTDDERLMVSIAINARKALEGQAA